MAQSKKQPLDRLRSGKKPVRKTVHLASDPEFAAEVEAMESDLRRREASPLVRDGKASSAEVQLIANLRDKVTTGKQKIQDEAFTFIFESMRPKEFEDFVNDHKPSAGQVAAAEKDGVKGLNWNPETFPLALIDRCCIEPEHLPGELAAILEDGAWNQAEQNELFTAALLVQNTRQVVQMGKD